MGIEPLGDKFIEELWKKFSDVPVNNNDEIDTDFYIWEKGMDKMFIWQWFDQNYTKGLAYLMKL